MANRRLDTPLFQKWVELNIQDDLLFQGMTWLQKLLYRSLVQRMFVCETQPYAPCNDELLWILAGCESKQMWLENKEAILPKFTVFEQDGTKLLKHKRVEQDWLDVQDRKSALQQIRRDAGRKGGQKSGLTRKTMAESRENKKPELASNLKPVLPVASGLVRPASSASDTDHPSNEANLKQSGAIEGQSKSTVTVALPLSTTTTLTIPLPPTVKVYEEAEISPSGIDSLPAGAEAKPTPTATATPTPKAPVSRPAVPTPLTVSKRASNHNPCIMCWDDPCICSDNLPEEADYE